MNISLLSSKSSKKVSLASSLLQSDIEIVHYLSVIGTGKLTVSLVRKSSNVEMSDKTGDLSD